MLSFRLHTWQVDVNVTRWIRPEERSAIASMVMSSGNSQHADIRTRRQSIKMWPPALCSQADATFSNLGWPFSRRLSTMSQAVATTSTVMTSAIRAMSSADAEEGARRPNTPWMDEHVNLHLSNRQGDEVDAFSGESEGAPSPS